MKHTARALMVGLIASPEEPVAEIRAVDRRMAQRASLIFLGLVVERRNGRRSGVHRERVALQA